jgi:hypothetical protein
MSALLRGSGDVKGMRSGARSPSRPVWPPAYTNAVTRTISEGPVGRSVGVVDDASARSECGFKSCLDVFMRDGYVDVHRMA